MKVWPVIVLAPLLLGLRPVATAQSPVIADLQFAVSADSFEEAAYEFLEYGVADKETMTRLVVALQDAAYGRVAANQAVDLIDRLEGVVAQQTPTVRARLTEWLGIFRAVTLAQPVNFTPQDEARLLEWACSLKARP